MCVQGGVQGCVCRVCVQGHVCRDVCAGVCAGCVYRSMCAVMCVWKSVCMQASCTGLPRLPGSGRPAPMCWLPPAPRAPGPASPFSKAESTAATVTAQGTHSFPLFALLLCCPGWSRLPLAPAGGFPAAPPPPAPWRADFAAPASLSFDAKPPDKEGSSDSSGRASPGVGWGPCVRASRRRAAAAQRDVPGSSPALTPACRSGPFSLS